MKNLILISLCLLFKPFFSAGQTCTRGASRYDIRENGMVAPVTHTGNIFADGVFGTRPVIFDPEIVTIYSASTWLGGKDRSGNIRLSAATYRSRPSDFFSGPLQNGQISGATCQNWDTHWVVTFADIERHLRALRNPNGFRDTVVAIFNYPGRNNPYFRKFNGFDLPQNQTLAPFFDYNQDGNYTPQFGDYPLPENIKPKAAPDVMVWSVYNDIGGTRNTTGSLPIGAEIQQTVWAYVASSLLNECIFTAHKVIHKGTVPIDSFSFGLRVDFDLGCAHNDFVGCFPSSNAFYVYNRTNDDGINCGTSTRGFGTNPPVQAVTFLNRPLSKFMTTYGSTNNPPIGMTDPTNATEFFNVLNGRWRDGTPLTATKLGYNPSATNTTNFAFSGIPSDTTKWSMFQENRRASLPFYDVRAIGSTYVGTFNPSDTLRLDAVYSLHRGLNASNIENVPVMVSNLPQIFNLYQTQFAILGRPLAIEESDALYKLSIYPNPSTDELWILSDNAIIEDIAVYNAFGQLIPVEKTLKNAQFNVNVKPLSNGFYFLKIKINGKTTTRKIVIQH